MSDRPTASRRRARPLAVLIAIPSLAAAIASLPPVSPAVRAASRDPVEAAHGMVGSTERHASEAGLAMLKRGGNAIDAAVAVAFALAVTHPAAGNLGGGGFMVIRFADGRATTLDFREKAPARAHRDMFLDSTGAVVSERSLVGPLAAGVPGSVAGLCEAQRRFGRLALAEVMAPAIALAADGFEVSHALARSLAGHASLFSRFPETARTLLRDGRPYEPGDRLVQPDLARTLRLIAEGGPDAFYRGPIAALIVAEMERSGGLITADDLAAYEVKERAPIRGTYRGHTIISMPPPSSGGIALVQALNILEAFPIGELGANSSRTIHLVAEATRRVYADRAEWLGDPDFVRVPASGLTSKDYAARLRATIDPARATPSGSVTFGPANTFESDMTTHLSVVDADGTAVAMTTTLNGSYGNGQMVTGAGFLLNNEMDDFSAKPGTPNMFGLIGGSANAIAPGKRMLSSMTPTIVERDGRPFLVLGSPGGSRIITTVLQVVMNVVDHGMDVQEAVDAPRFHHQWLPDRLRLERQGFPRDVTDALQAMGHELSVGDDMGDVHAILIDPETGRRFGASDPRMDGVTVGY